MRARFGFHFSQTRYFAFIARFPRAEMLLSSRPWFNRGSVSDSNKALGAGRVI
jgi:hypothetical protein